MNIFKRGVFLYGQKWKKFILMPFEFMLRYICKHKSFNFFCFHYNASARKLSVQTSIKKCIHIMKNFRRKN